MDDKIKAFTKFQAQTNLISPDSPFNPGERETFILRSEIDWVYLLINVLPLLGRTDRGVEWGTFYCLGNKIKKDLIEHIW